MDAESLIAGLDEFQTIWGYSGDQFQEACEKADQHFTVAQLYKMDKAVAFYSDYRPATKDEAERHFCAADLMSTIPRPVAFPLHTRPLLFLQPFRWHVGPALAQKGALHEPVAALPWSAAWRVQTQRACARS